MHRAQERSSDKPNHEFKVSYLRLWSIRFTALTWLLSFTHVCIGAEGPEGPVITAPSTILPHGIKGVDYNYMFEQKGGVGDLKWKSGANPKDLPAGLKLDERSGDIYGIPTNATPKKSVEITVEDTNNRKHTRDFWITVFEDKEKRNAAIDNECFVALGEKSSMGDLGPYVSVGPTVTTQLVRYNLATEKASINAQGLGLGASFRFYTSNDMESAPGSTVKDIRRIRPKCRATTISTFDADAAQYKASSWLSLTPTLFASVDEAQGSASSEVSVQPAIMVGFLRDLINVGVGWNLAGPNRGQTFLLMGLGAGFKF